MGRATYKVNEMFYSLQGEGMRAGTPNVFVRFSACNLDCNLAVHGFDCDTDFVSGEKMTALDIVTAAKALVKTEFAEGEDMRRECRNVIFTGGEPALQLDDALLDEFAEWHTAIETNGTKPFPVDRVDWVCVSPKPPDDNLAIKHCDEVKFVRATGQPLPVFDPRSDNFIVAEHYVVSPAHNGEEIDRESLDWCIKLVKENPTWRLSVQQHKQWRVR